MSLYYSKKLPALLTGITSKHNGDFYCLSCLHSFAKENKRESHKKVFENKDFCNVVICVLKTFNQDFNIKTLEFNQYKKIW